VFLHKHVHVMEACFRHRNINIYIYIGYKLTISSHKVWITRYEVAIASNKASIARYTIKICKIY